MPTQRTNRRYRAGRWITSTRLEKAPVQGPGGPASTQPDGSVPDRHPQAFGPLYAAGRPTELTDPSGYAPYEQEPDLLTEIYMNVSEATGGGTIAMAGDPKAVAIAVAAPVGRTLLSRGSAAVAALVAEVVTPTSVSTASALGTAALAQPTVSASQGGDRTWGQDVALDPDGHAWDHAQDGDFGDIEDHDDLGQYLDGVIGSATDSKELDGGRQAWLGEDGTIVIHNPDGPSTAFNPDSQGKSSQDYWDFDL